MRTVAGVICLLLSLLRWEGAARAAIPWYVDPAGSGRPFTWGGGYLPWYIEKADFKDVPFAKVQEVVQEAFETWQNAALFLPGMIKVSAVKIAPTLVGVINQQITTDNLLDVYKKQVTFVMDPDGSLLQSLGYSPKDAAAATILNRETWDAAAVTLRSAVTILSGKFLEGAKPDDPNDPTMQFFRAFVTHEIGHLFNLDHSALGQDLNVLSNPDLAQGIPTMYPVVMPSGAQADLHMDDVVALATLYPSADFSSKFCIITGQLLGADQKGFQGALVIARAKDSPLTEAISAITGSNFPGPSPDHPAWTADGTYILRGIKPGLKYTVEYGELKSDWTCESAVGSWGDNHHCPANPDYDEPPRSGFGKGGITAGNGKLKEVSCEGGNKVIPMDTITLNVPAGGDPPKNSQIAPPPPAPAANAQSGGGCTLVF